MAQAHDPIWALGCMSGTSMDGVDGALIKTDGHQIFEFGDTDFWAFSEDEQKILNRAMGQWQGGKDVPEVEDLVRRRHVDVIKHLINKSFSPDYIGFHGQTLAHDPNNGATHQAGDGQALAQDMSCPVVWDFRTNDVKLGGQGAPLAPFFHHACARYIGETEPVAFLNLGGVGNLTWVDPRLHKPELAGACLAFDTGPANAPLNDVMQGRLGLSYDKDGALALSGKTDERVVDTFMTQPYFSKMPPKSLDRNEFLNLIEMVNGLSNQDALRSLAACAAQAVARAMEHCPTPPSRVLVTGGGRHNAALMQELRQRLWVPVIDIDQTGLNGDMLEAQAFGYLAVRVVRGLPTSAPMTTGVTVPVGGGIVSSP